MRFHCIILLFGKSNFQMFNFMFKFLDVLHKGNYSPYHVPKYDYVYFDAVNFSEWRNSEEVISFF